MRSFNDVSESFIALGLFLLRNGSHPAFGIAAARSMFEAQPSLEISLAFAFSIWMPILGFSFLCIAIGEALDLL